VAAVAGALGDQTAAIASEKTVATPRIASTAKPLATSALVLSAVILCWPSGWSAIRGRVYRQSHDEETICDFRQAPHPDDHMCWR
jgi:hypothetical protein